jgi:predicted Zn-dependent protease with MMP-like domain
VDRVLDSLPPSLEPALSEVAVVVEDWPIDVDRDDAPYGWYEGTPTSLTADEPRKITIFRGPLEADFPRQADLEREVRLTIEHELAHHFAAEDHDDRESEDDVEDEGSPRGVRARVWRWLTRP